jgi:hypothetical protein
MPSALSLQHEPPQTSTRQSSQKNSGAQTTVTLDITLKLIRDHVHADAGDAEEMAEKG